MSLRKGKLAVVTGGSSVIEVAQASRRSFIIGHADRDVLVLGTNCPTPAVGRIMRTAPAGVSSPIKARCNEHPRRP